MHAVGETLVTHRLLIYGEKGKPAMGTGQRDDARHFQAVSIGETKSTRSRSLGILNSVACKMNLVHLFHVKYFLDRSDRRLQEDGSCELRITALMCSNSMAI